MEYETPHAPRIDPLITVESGDPHTPAQAASQARNVACRHRLRWRDLIFMAKYQFALHLGFSIAALAVAVGCMFEGGVALRAGLASDDLLLFALGGVELVVAALLTIGPIAYLRLWRSPHRPERATVVNYATAWILFLFFIGANADGREWLMLLAFPAYMVGTELRVMRRMLTDRSTCSTDLTQPIALRSMTAEGDRWPVTDEQRAWILGPRVVRPGFDSWRCPHMMFWDDMRRRAKLEWLAWRSTQVLYWMGLMITSSAMFVHDDQLLAASPIPLPEWTPILALLVFGYLLQLANRASRGPFLHRADIAVHVLGTAGHLLIAALAAAMALELDRPYFWAVTALALTQAYLVVALMVTQTPWARCEAEPELHRIAQASFKPGRGRAPFLDGQTAL